MLPSKSLPAIGMSCDGREPVAAFRDKVAAGEAGGATSVWLASHLFQRDPITQATMALSSTARMRAVLMAMSPYVMHPVHCAMAAASLDEFFPGRIALCLAVGAPADLISIGVGTPRPIRHLREAIEMTRALLSGETVTYNGEIFKVRSRRLTAGHRAVPILLGASGPQMLELAGAIADGVLISAGASVEFVKWSLEHVHRGARGRAIRTSGLIYASVDEDATLAHRRLRRTLAIVLRGGHHARNLQLGGSRLDQERLNKAVIAEDWASAEDMITDDIMSCHAASGRRDQVRARFAEYHAAGLDEVVIAGANSGQQISEILGAALNLHGEPVR